jgi:hypothetical protein
MQSSNLISACKVPSSFDSTNKPAAPRYPPGGLDEAFRRTGTQVRPIDTPQTGKIPGTKDYYVFKDKK